MKDIEVIELTETLKAGNEVYNKGLVLDRKNGPFPSVIVVEIAAVKAGKSRALKILRTRADVKKEEQQVRDIENAKHEAEATVKKKLNWKNLTKK
uniref:Uncharacterized protein n=1 Tax=viral metagenome TaxID=1070528 RepID=A0A6M3IRW3_9ZZZZ